MTEVPLSIATGAKDAPAAGEARAPARWAAALSWALRGITALILFQTLFFKFSGAKESVYIFTTLGMEPWGRIGSGVAELIACILILIPRTVSFGALLALGVISGAIVSHIMKLGIVVMNDGGLLFALGLIVFACSSGILLIRQRELTGFLRRALLARGHELPVP